MSAVGFYCCYVEFSREAAHCFLCAGASCCTSVSYLINCCISITAAQLAPDWSTCHLEPVDAHVYVPDLVSHLSPQKILKMHVFLGLVIWMGKFLYSNICYQIVGWAAVMVKFPQRGISFLLFLIYWRIFHIVGWSILQTWWNPAHENSNNKSETAGLREMRTLNNTTHRLIICSFIS